MVDRTLGTRCTFRRRIKPIKTMNTFIRPMLAAVVCAAAACSPIEELTYQSTGGELSISVNTVEPTRGIITDSVLPDGSQIAIAIFNPDGSKYMNKNYSYLLYTAENGEGSQIWKTNSSVILGESEAVLYACHPYETYTFGDMRNLQIKANNYYQDDFMYAGPYTGLNADNRHVNITLKHALAAVRLTTSRGSYEGIGSIHSIGMGSPVAGTGGYFDVTQGKFTSVSTGGTIYPTTSFELSDGPNTQYFLLIPTGGAGELKLTMTIDGTTYTMSVPDVLLEAGKITELNVSVDKTKLNLKSVTVAEWYRTDRATISAPADYRVTLDGDQEGISIGTVIGTDKSVTITAVPYVSKDAKVNPVTFEGDATFSQQMNERTGVRTITIQELKSHVTVTFDGITL